MSADNQDPSDNEIILVPFGPEEGHSSQELPAEILCPSNNNFEPLLENKKQSIIVYAKISKWLCLVEAFLVFFYAFTETKGFLFLWLVAPLGFFAAWKVHKLGTLVYIIYLVAHLILRVILMFLFNGLWNVLLHFVCSVFEICILLIFFRFFRLIRPITEETKKNLFDKNPDEVNLPNN